MMWLFFVVVQVSDIVRFEVDSDQLKAILSQVENIQTAIEEHMRV